MARHYSTSAAPGKRTVPRITLEVLRLAYSRLAKQNSYFIYEEGRDAIQGCALRVLRREVQIGIRADRGRTWIKVAVVSPEVDMEELEELRLAVRRKIRNVEDEDEEPSLREGRRMTVARLRAAYRAEYMLTRSKARSIRTLEHYDDLWEGHLLPLIGVLSLRAVTVQVAKDLKMEVRARVQAKRPWADGRHTANHVLQQGQASFNWARKMGYLVRNPFDFVDPYEVDPAEAPGPGDPAPQGPSPACPPSNGPTRLPSAGDGASRIGAKPCSQAPQARRPDECQLFPSPERAARDRQLQDIVGELEEICSISWVGGSGCNCRWQSRIGRRPRSSRFHWRQAHKASEAVAPVVSAMHSSVPSGRYTLNFEDKFPDVRVIVTRACPPRPR